MYPDLPFERSYFRSLKIVDFRGFFDPPNLVFKIFTWDFVKWFFYSFRVFWAKTWKFFAKNLEDIAAEKTAFFAVFFKFSNMGGFLIFYPIGPKICQKTGNAKVFFHRRSFKNVTSMSFRIQSYIRAKTHFSAFFRFFMNFEVF